LKKILHIYIYRFHI
jgi:hypothetical protein